MEAIKKVNLLVVNLILVVAIQTQAQWATDAAVNNAVSVATGIQQNAKQVSDNNGGVILVWEDYRNGAGDIYAQRFNSSGIPQWTANGVIVCNATDIQRNPVITSDGSGGAVIAWQDRRSGLSYDIYAQRINSNGVIQWTSNGVTICNAINDQQKIVIVPHSTIGTYFVWEDYRNGTDFDIYVQYVGIAAGNSVFVANGMPVINSIGNQVSPVVVYTGDLIVAWADTRSGDDIYAQKLNSAGSQQWSSDGVAICTATGGQADPEAISDGSGGAIVTWTDTRSGNADIYAQRINSNGSTQWTVNGIAVSSAANNQLNPYLARSSSGNVILVWEDNRNGNYDIYAQRISSSGIPEWTANGVAVCSAPGGQVNAKIEYIDFDTHIIGWEDSRGTDTDIYAQRINNSGQSQWLLNGVAITNAPTNQGSFDLIGDTSFNGGAFFAWHDNRGINTDVYIQRIGENGNLCGNVTTPGAISGNTTILAGTSSIYSVSTVTGATAYTWTLPTGWTGTSVTHSITATSSGSGGNITVSASNLCGPSIGSSSLAITVNKQNQTITFNTLSSKAMGDAAFDLTATASSTLPISYTSSNTAVATISGSTVTLVGVGTTTITASQPGNDIFNTAPNVLRDLVVNKGNQTITFAALSSKAVGDAPFALTATSSSSLPVEYTSSNTSIATISGNTVTLVAAGNVTIHANQPGNSNFNAATQVSQSFCVNPAKPTIASTGVNTESPTLTSNATSGNQWFLNDAAIVGATNATLAIAAAGIYKVQVTTGGCTSAFSDNFTFVITGDDSFASSKSQFSIFPNPTFDRLTVSLPNDYQIKEVSIYTINGQRVDFNETYGREVQFDVAGYSPGVYLIKMSSTRTKGIIRFTKQ